MSEPRASYPVQVIFHGVRRSPDLEQAARAHAEHLTRFHARIHGCVVTIRQAEGGAHTGRYEVQIRVSIPGQDVNAGGHHSPPQPGHEDPYLALSSAFRAAERQLEDRSRIQRGEVKTHPDTGAARRATG